MSPTADRQMAAQEVVPKMWKGFALAVVLVFALSHVVAQQSETLKEIQKRLLAREAALKGLRTDWEVSDGSRRRTITVTPFDKAYWLRIGPQADTPEQEAVLLSEQPFAYIWRFSSGGPNIVQNLTWVHGSKLLPLVWGVNLLRYYGSNAKDVKVETAGQYVRISGQLGEHFPRPVLSLPVQATLVLLLDPTRDYAPAEAHLYFNTPDQVLESAKVLEWGAHQGTWLPALVDFDFTRRGKGVMRVRLASARQYTGTSPKWFSIPMPVSDWRLGITEHEVVTYEFEGQLPSPEELSRLRKQQKGENASPARSKTNEQGASNLILPFLLITTGAFWYWRVRQGERKT